MTDTDASRATLIQAHIRRNAGTGRETERVGPFLATFSPVNPNPYLSYAIPDAGARPTGSDVTALADAFERRDRMPRLEYLPVLAPEVEPVLLRAGFTVEGRLPLMVCGGGTPHPPPEGFELLVPETDAELREVAAVQYDAFGEPESPSDDDVSRLRALLADGGLVVLGREVSTGAGAAAGVCDRVDDGVGELAGLGVRERYRRHGLGAAITWWLTRAALDAGAGQVFLTPAGDAQKRIYARVGFRAVDEILHISRPRAASIPAA